MRFSPRSMLVLVAILLAVFYFAAPTLDRVYITHAWAGETAVVREYLTAAASRDSLAMHRIAPRDDPAAWTRQAEAKKPGFLRSAASSLRPVEGDRSTQLIGVSFAVDQPLCADAVGTPFRIAAFFVNAGGHEQLVSIRSIPC